jgi:hypothetical protein
MLKNIFLFSIFFFIFVVFYSNQKTESSTVINLLLVKTAPEKQVIPNNYDQQKFEEVMELAITEKLSQQSLDRIMQRIAQQFVGAKYQAGLLDKTNKETLIVSLTQFDCVLFIETVLGLVRGIAIENYTYPAFVNHIQEQRYRNNNITYCDRLHYFSDWINTNQNQGIVVNLTPSLGGIALNKQLNFMSVNRSKYPQLKNDENNLQCIKKVEENLTQLNLTYIPTNKIKNIYPQLKSGDIIGITTQIQGLDVTHTGLIYKQNNQTGLIHASPAGQVTIAQDLQRYVQNVPKAIGILVVRPNFIERN